MDGRRFHVDGTDHFLQLYFVAKVVKQKEKKEKYNVFYCEKKNVDMKIIIAKYFIVLPAAVVLVKSQ